MSERVPENKMGVMPVNKLLLSMSVPIMIAMLIQALYNVVDSIFVARISERALTAVGMAFPIQNLMISLAVGTGVGINALLSKSLGEKDFERANKTAENGVFITIVTCLIFMAVGTLVARPFYLAQTDITEIVENGVVYMVICSLFSGGLFLEITFERLLQSTGRTFLTMITQGVGAVINIVMDPILIFGLGPFPRMGVAGAAAATVFGQIVAAVLTIVVNQRCNTDLKLSLRHFRPDGWIIKKIYAVGAPSIIMNSISSVMTFGMNKILLAFTDTAAAVLTVYGKMQSFVFMPVFGLNNGLVPIIAYNYGAREKKRLMQSVKLAMAYTVGIMAVGLLVMQLIPDKIFMLFDASEGMLALGIPAMRIISIGFPLAGCSIIMCSTFQALGRGVQSMMTSIARQLVVLLPVAWLFSLSGQVGMVWWAYPVSEVVALVLCVVLFAGTYRKVIQPLSAG